MHGLCLSLAVCFCGACDTCLSLALCFFIVMFFAVYESSGCYDVLPSFIVSTLPFLSDYHSFLLSDCYLIIGLICPTFSYFIPFHSLFILHVLSPVPVRRCYSSCVTLFRSFHNFKSCPAVSRPLFLASCAGESCIFSLGIVFVCFLSCFKLLKQIILYIWVLSTSLPTNLTQTDWGQKQRRKHLKTDAYRIMRLYILFSFLLLAGEKLQFNLLHHCLHFYSKT